MRDLNPSIIIGYNHSGYDVPLIRIKMNRRSYSKQLWNLKRILSTSYLLDMMYVIADDLYEFDGDYRLRKLSEVVIHPRYGELKLQRSKYLTKREGMPVNKAIELMWKEEPDNFREYCSGDTRDLMSIFSYIFLDRT
jgi:DNA polymerase elongation subunit (family B)